jgi:uncharacterized membrane protein YbhN (UPF0104 family)
VTVTSRGRRLAILAFLGVALIFVGLLLRGQWTALDGVMESARSFDWSFHPWWIAGAIAVGIANLFLMALVWTDLFRRTGGTAGHAEAVRVWVVTNFGRYIPGKVWQLGGLAVYMKGRGDSGAAALVSAVAFQLIALVTGAAIAVATIGVGWAGLEGGWLPGLVTLALILVTGLHPGVLSWIARRLGSWFGETGVSVTLGAGDIARSAAGLLVAWLLYGAGFLMLVRGVGVPWELAQLPVLTGVFAASYIVGYLVLVAPGGLVVREGAMTALLVEAGGLAVGVAAPVAIIARLWVVATELGALAVVLAWRGSSKEEERAV